LCVCRRRDNRDKREERRDEGRDKIVEEREKRSE